MITKEVQVVVEKAIIKTIKVDRIVEKPTTKLSYVNKVK